MVAGNNAKMTWIFFSFFIRNLFVQNSTGCVKQISETQSEKNRFLLEGSTMYGGSIPFRIVCNQVLHFIS